MSGQQQQRPGNNTGKDSDMSTSRQEEMRQAPTKPPSLQIEAADAAKQALEAQQDAQEAVKRAYAKQLVAQEKAQQVTQQLAAQNETANEVAVMAAKQAAEQAAEQALKGQKEVLEQQFDQRMIAQEAARSTLAAARQQPFIDQGLKTGSPAVSSSAEQGFGKAPPSIHQQGATAEPALPSGKQCCRGRAGSDGWSSATCCRCPKFCCPAGSNTASCHCAAEDGSRGEHGTVCVVTRIRSPNCRVLVQAST